MDATLLSSALLIVKAQQEVATNILSKREFSVHIDTVQRQLKDQKFTGVKFVEGTRDEEARFVFAKSKAFELLMVAFESGQFQVELYDKAKDKSYRSKKTRLLKTALVDLKKLSKRMNKALETTSNGLTKTAVDRTTRNPKVAKKAGKDVVTVPDFKNSATKARNWVIKTAGGRAMPSIGSNPYSDVQMLNAILTPTQKSKLDAAFKAAGIKLTTAKRSSTTLEFNQDQLTIMVPTKSYKAYGGKVFYDIGFFGAKKAKPTTIPYYD